MFYHLSEVAGLYKLTPRIPSIALDTYEDTTIPRVCFSDSIDGCLSALQYAGNFFVYIPLNEPKLIIPTREQVKDAEFTHEHWCLEEVPVKCLGKVNAGWNYRIKNHVIQIGEVEETVDVFHFPWHWSKKFKNPGLYWGVEIEDENPN